MPPTDLSPKKKLTGEHPRRPVGQADTTDQAPSSSNRRDFLMGVSAVRAIRDGVEHAGTDWPGETQGTDGAAGLWEQYTKPAMACQFEISFNLHQYRQASTATMLAFQKIDDLEDQLTIYRDHSELMNLNRIATQRPVKTELGLLELLSLAKQIHASTGGAFDITAGDLSRLWGFERGSGRLPDQAELASALSNVGSEKIVLDDQNQTVHITADGVKINLGGIGKGYALDRVADLFLDHKIKDFAIHGGQSSVLARGSSRSNQSSAGWIVGISHPTIANQRLGRILLRDHALGTSGTARQGFFHQGKRYGHIIDPRTGWPTDHHLSTTVVSPSAAQSDALATAFFVMSTDEVSDYCRLYPDVKAVLVQSLTKHTGRVKVITFNFDEHDISISDDTT